VRTSAETQTESPGPGSPPPPLKAVAILRRLTNFREFMILAILAAGCIVMSFLSPTFMTPGNWSALLLQVSVEVIVAIGMTILLVSGGFDLSVGSTFAIGGAVTAMAMVSGVPTILAIAIGLLIGTTIGFINGFIIARIGINPFVTTLAMMSIVRGMLLVITRGGNISGLPADFRFIGEGHVFGVQNPILIALFMVFIGDILLRKSAFFRQNYYLGGNEHAAVLSGIRVDRLKIFNYALTGFLAAFAGIIMTARLRSASVTAGTGLELKVISAVIIGGASLKGGEGTVLGAFLGALLMGILVGALTLLGVDVYWNTLVIGATLLVAVLIDNFGRRRRKLE
jgi:ribose transport system permease protein